MFIKAECPRIKLGSHGNLWLAHRPPVEAREPDLYIINITFIIIIIIIYIYILL